MAESDIRCETCAHWRRWRQLAVVDSEKPAVIGHCHEVTQANPWDPTINVEERGLVGHDFRCDSWKRRTKDEPPAVLLLEGDVSGPVEMEGDQSGHLLLGGDAAV